MNSNFKIDIKPIDIKQFRVEKKIDRRYNFVNYRIKDNNLGRKYTAKVLISSIPELSESEIEEFSRNVNLLSNLNSPAIVNFIGYSLQNFNGEPYPVIITESYKNYTINDLINLEKKGSAPSEWDDTKKLINIFGIASAMAYIHSKDIILYDFKPNSIFLDQHLFPKIGDFSNAREVTDVSSSEKPSYQIFSQLSVGTPLYVAPELIEGEEFTKACDVYSFALIIYEMLTLANPFQNMRGLYSGLADVLNGKRPHIDSSIDDCYRELIERCWADDPKKRPTFDEIVNLLKTDERFILDTVDKVEFEDYCDYISESLIPYKFKDFKKVHINFQKNTEPKQLTIDENIKEINLSLYEKIIKVGEGAFGSVYKIREKNTKKIYAAKILKYELESYEDNMLINLSREINIISKLNYPNILKFIGYSSRNLKDEPKPTIVTEFILNGSLNDILDNERNGLASPDWNDTKKLINIYGIAAGMAYLHSRNILHRDLKPDNIYLDDFLFPKIGDFGLSKKLTDLINGIAYIKGTFPYLSPEILVDEKYMKASDVYAFGMVVYEIMTTKKPLEGFTQFQIIFQVPRGYRPPIDNLVPECYRNLINKCWQKKPEKRPTFKQIIQLLTTNNDFILDTVNEDEFIKYVDYINKKVLNKKSCKQISIKKELSSNKKDNENEESDSELLFIKLSNFQRLKFLNIGDNSKIYEVRGKKTGNVYAAKVSTVNISNLSRNELADLSNEANIISNLNHPSFLKFIGFSPTDFKNRERPVIISELPPNRSLSQLLEKIRNGEKVPEWNDTTKLIIIYGIASGMSYLHSKDVLHRNLTSYSIFLDEFLFPKIGNFGMTIRHHTIKSMTFQSMAEMKGNPIYFSPELFQTNEYSELSDVYAFAIIVYEIMTLKVPFDDIKSLKILIDEVAIKGKRPDINIEIPDSYQSLIEKCWSQLPNERPTFDDIEFALSNDKGFITPSVNVDHFNSYVQCIRESKLEFYSQKKVHFVNLNEKKSKIKENDNENENLGNAVNEGNHKKKGKEAYNLYE